MGNCLIFNIVSITNVIYWYNYSSIFTEILMICTCTLIAFTRNEVNLFWSGKFYDEILENPFKNEMDKKSVKIIHFLNIGVSKDLRK